MCLGSPKTPPPPPMVAPAPPPPIPTAKGVAPTKVSKSRLAAYGGYGISKSLLKRLRIPLGTGSMGGGGGGGGGTFSAGAKSPGDVYS